MTPRWRKPDSNPRSRSVIRELSGLHSELFDPIIAAHNGRLVKTIGDGFLVEFSSVVDALRCASEVQGCTAEPDTPGPHPVAENLATY